MNDTIIGSGDPVAINLAQRLTVGDVERSERHHPNDIASALYDHGINPIFLKIGDQEFKVYCERWETTKSGVKVSLLVP